MNQPKELEWNRMFSYDLPAVRPAKNPHECCDACKEAKEVKCVCPCGGKNHGVANRVGMEPLEKALGLDGLTVTVTKEAPALLGDLALSRELSGLAELEGEI
jgi:hypothetical protein